MFIYIYLDIWVQLYSIATSLVWGGEKGFGCKVGSGIQMFSKPQDRQDEVTYGAEIEGSGEVWQPRIGTILLLANWGWMAGWCPHRTAVVKGHFWQKHIKWIMLGYKLIEEKWLPAILRSGPPERLSFKLPIPEAEYRSAKKDQGKLLKE